MVDTIKAIPNPARQGYGSRRRYDSATNTREQGLAKFGFERPNAQAYRSGGEGQAISGAGKAAHADAHLEYSQGFKRGTNS